MCEFSVKPVKDDQNRGWKGLAPLVPPYNCLRKYHEQLVSANIMNNPYAVTEIQKAIGLRGIEFRDKVVLLKEQVADFFEVTPPHGGELSRCPRGGTAGKRLRDPAWQRLTGTQVSHPRAVWYRNRLRHQNHRSGDTRLPCFP